MRVLLASDIIIELSAELLAWAQQVAAERGESVEETCNYLLGVALGVREPDPGDTRAEVLRAMETGKFGRG